MGRGFSLSDMSKERASKILIYGVVIAIIFGTLISTSISIASNAGSWKLLADLKNSMAYWDGLYGYDEYLRAQQGILHTSYWMVYQGLIVQNVGRIGVNIGLILIFIGFIGFATNDKMDEKARKISLVLAGLILFIVLITLFFPNMVISIS